MGDNLRVSRADPPTYAEAVASTETEVAAARARLDVALQRLRRVRRYGRDPNAALLEWNLARNEVEHRRSQLERWRRILAERPELAPVPILDRWNRPQLTAPEPPAVASAASTSHTRTQDERAGSLPRRSSA